MGCVRLDLPGRSVGHGHRDGAAGSGRRARRVRDPSRRLRAARRGALRVPARHGRRHHRPGLAHDSCRRRHAPQRRTEAARRRLHRGRQLGGGRRHHRRGSRDWRHAAGGHGSRRQRAAQDARRLLAERRCVQRAPQQAGRRRAHHDRSVAGLPKRPRQPGDRAGHARRRRHAGARLALRTSAVRTGADERHGRGPVPLRSPPHHRHRAMPPAGQAAGQPGYPLGNGVDCSGAGRGWTEPGRAARDRRTRLQPARGAVAGARRRRQQES